VARICNSFFIINIVANEGADIFSTCVFNNIVASREKNGAPFFICPRGTADGNSLIISELDLGRFVRESHKWHCYHQHSGKPRAVFEGRVGDPPGSSSRETPPSGLPAGRRLPHHRTRCASCPTPSHASPNRARWRPIGYRIDAHRLRRASAHI
jgi:hypothetical protein